MFIKRIHCFCDNLDDFTIVASDGLHVDHSVVVSLFYHQLLVCADLGHFASIDHSDYVSILDGGHAMGYHYGGTICEQGRGGRREGGEEEREEVEGGVGGKRVNETREILQSSSVVLLYLSEPCQGQLAL